RTPSSPRLWRSDWRGAASRRGPESRDPVARDRVAPGEPDRAPVAYVLQHALEPADAAGASDHPQVKPDRQHLRRRGALAPQGIERVVHVLREIARGDEALLALMEVHVVGVEAVGNHEMRAAVDVDEEGQVVAVGV